MYVNLVDHSIASHSKWHYHRLLILDGFGFDENGTNANATECSSSLTSDISRDSSSISDRMSETNSSRPLSGTSQFVDISAIESTSRRRPSTAGMDVFVFFFSSACLCDLTCAFIEYFHLVRLESSICSGGEPIVGNIVNKVRRKRRDKQISKPSESTSTSMSSLLESSLQNISKFCKFPMQLPQSVVTLEMGLMNTETMPCSESQPGKTDEDQDVHQLIEMCRRWRELSRKSREKHSIDSERHRRDKN